MMMRMMLMLALVVLPMRSTWSVVAIFFFIVATVEIQCFDVRQHLSSATSYDAAKALTSKLVEEANVLPPVGCTPVHLNIVARHGTRAPTKKRIKQLNLFEEQVRYLASTAPRAPAWMKEWQSPWKGRTMGGELLSKGEEEMYELGRRIHAQYEVLFKEDYHPDLYLISTTQVPRSAASAVAFGMGLFAGKGTLGPGSHRAFAVLSDSRTHDVHLRFYETCGAYKLSKAMGQPEVSSIQKESFMEIAASLTERFGLNVTSDDISTLWFLCKQQAVVLDIVDQTCQLFTKEEVELLEWADDVEIHHLKGYGQSINYRMGIPLLSNVFESMERAIFAQEVAGASTSVERAHMRFAHAETLIPFLCLLGLFLDNEDVHKVRNELPLPPPPPPPESRLWRGSAAAPYGGNTQVVLYKCSVRDGSTSDDYGVQVFHNEKSMILPACNGSHFCSYKTFKDHVVLPHLKHSYETLCSVRSQTSESSWIWRLGMKIFQFFGLKGSSEDRAEL